MPNNTIYAFSKYKTTTIRNWKAKDVEHSTIEECIDRIRTDPDLKSTIDELHACSDSDEQKELKATIPAFFPTVVLDPDSGNILNKKCVPTSIIQFDVDIAGKQDAAFCDALGKRLLSNHDSIVYMFKSPRNGLKFGVLTDLHLMDGESYDSFKERYKLAYDLVLEQLGEKFKDDSKVRKFKQACLLSYDENAFYNADAQVIILNDLIKYTIPEYDTNVTTTEHRQEDVKHILKFIPHDLGYDDRRNINMAIFTAIGSCAIPLLMAHWQRADIEKQIIAQSRKPFAISWGLLVNHAKANGYKPLKRAKPKNVPVLQSLKTIHESRHELKSLVEKIGEDVLSCPADAFDLIIKGSTGLGKSEQCILICLMLYLKNVKILFAVPTHNLANEMLQRFKELRVTDGSRRIPRNEISVWSGLERLCKAPKRIKPFIEKNITVPKLVCENCLLFDRCAFHIQHKRESTIKIKIVTHAELLVEQSQWSKNATFKPHLIIADESILQTRHDRLSDSAQQVVRNVANAIDNDIDLEEALDQNATEIRAAYKDAFLDSKNIALPNPLKSPIQYCETLRDIKRKQCRILKIFRRFQQSKQDAKDHLMKCDDLGILHDFKPIHERYSNIPIVRLDATTNPVIQSHIAPNAKFYSIQAEHNASNRIIVDNSMSYSKTWLSQPKNMDAICKKLKRLIFDSKSVGLITYKPFVNSVAETLGIPDDMVGYFGSLRGIDKWRDVKMLIILGRHELPATVIEDECIAICGLQDDYSTTKKYMPVRMADANHQYVLVKQYNSRDTQATYDELCVAETLQAIGRHRHFHGKDKTTYVFTNQYLGTDITISEFVTDDQVQQIQKKGFILDKCAEFVAVGYTQYQYKRQKQAIVSELTSHEIFLETHEYIDLKHRKKTVRAYVADELKFTQYLK